MATFKYYFKRNGDLSFNGMRNTAMKLLPNDSSLLDQLYNELMRGTRIYEDEDHLNVYLRSFGKMHQAKLNTAFESYPKLQQVVLEGVEIYDWGCGQGVATICLLDYLKKRG